MPGTPFSLNVEHLTSLAPDRAVEFFRRLLWAEAGRVGVSRHLIEVPQCINVPDGGLDASIPDCSPTTIELIPGRVGFQIKATDLGPTACRRELHQGGDLSRPIQPGVRSLLDAGGTYVLVLFKDLSYSLRSDREKALREELRKSGYPDARVRIVTASQLVGFAERFYSLVSWLRDDLNYCSPYESWADQEIQFPKDFIADGERTKILDELQSKLRSASSAATVIRVTGLPGIGKTRLVYEALKPDDLRRRVVYVHADAFLLSPLLNRLQNDKESCAIVVVDGCNLDQHFELVRAFSGQGSRISLITLSFDKGRVSAPTALYDLPPLGEEYITQVVKSEFPSLPTTIVPHIAKFADGYPGIAVLLGQSFVDQSSPGNLLAITDDTLMGRLIGDAHQDPAGFRDTENVLMHLSLFQKVGYEGDLSAEAKWLAERAGVSWQRFREVVADQKRRGILQGNNYLYVTPFMLRVYLLREWWDVHGLTEESFNDLVGSIPQAFRADLFERFVEHIPYIGETERGNTFVAAMLGPDGLFSNGALFRSELGARFFCALAEADPDAGVACLKRTVGTWSKADLLAYDYPRQHLVWALEAAAMHRRLFADAARLLLTLGEAENATNSNNASGTFAGLFSLARGSGAPTGTPPLERLPVLAEALDSESPERRALGLRACGAALRTSGGMRIIGPEFQGLRRPAEQWTPKTWGEVFDAYRAVWNLLLERLDTLPEEERGSASKVLIDHARDVALLEDLHSLVIDTLRDLADKPFAPKNDLIKSVIQTIRFDGMGFSPESLREWERLRNDLTGTSFGARLRRYAGIVLFEEEYDEHGQRTGASERVLSELATEGISRPDLLELEFPWLVLPTTENGFQFGYLLARADENFSLLPKLLQEQEDSNASENLMFLNGYGRYIAEHAPDRWQEILDALSNDPRRQRWVPELTQRSGRVADGDAKRVLDLVQRGAAPSGTLRMFVFGGALNAVTDRVLKDWLEYLLDRGDYISVSAAMDIIHMQFVLGGAGRQLPSDLTLRLLTHGAWFQPAEGGRYQMDEYNWVEVARAFIRRHPDEALSLLDPMVEHFGEDGTIAGGFYPRAAVVLTMLMEKYPSTVWKRVLRYLGPPIDQRAFHLKAWLHGGRLFDNDQAPAGGPLNFVPTDDIWEWVDEAPESRAWYLASFVPKVLDAPGWKRSLAREVLIRYGQREDVRRNLSANFGTEGWWSGQATAHFARRKAELLKLLETEQEPNVRLWLEERLAALQHEIRFHEVREEREGR